MIIYAFSWKNLPQTYQLIQFFIQQMNTYLDWMKATQQTDHQPDVYSYYRCLVLCYNK